MERSNQVPASRQIYHFHWLAVWKPLSGVSFLLVLGIGGVLIYGPVGLISLALALLGAVAIYLWWSRRTLAFTPDNRLLLRRGFLGCSEDVISLFGTITPYQIPVLGRCLDVGSVYLGLPGPDIHIRHIARFGAFRHQLIYGQQQRASYPSLPPIQVVVQLPPAQLLYGDWHTQLSPGEPGPRQIYSSAAFHEDE